MSKAYIIESEDGYFANPMVQGWSNEFTDNLIDAQFFPTEEDARDVANDVDEDFNVTCVVREVIMVINGEVK